MTERMTIAQLKAHQKPKGKKRVSGAIRTEVDGIKFDSKLEARHWQRLCLLQSAGQISDLERQVKIVLLGRDGPILTPTGRPMTYVADFVWRENGAEVIADAKGFQTEVSRIKLAILAAQGRKVKLLR